MSNLLDEIGLSDSSDNQGIAEDEETSVDKSRKKKVWTIVGLTGIGIVLAAGLAILLGLLFAPEKTEEVIMDTVTKAQDTAQRAVPALEPDIVLGRTGGQAELDVCDGTWINQQSYVDVLGKPSYSAHNGCNGRLILEKKVGDTVNVRNQAGVVKKYKVIEAFNMPLEGTQITDLKGHKGEMMLQTCNWGWATLKFVTLDPVAKA